MGSTRDHLHLHDTVPTPPDKPPTANDRFKERARSWFWGSLSAAAAVHFLLFAFLPALQASDGTTERDEIEVLDIPELDVPDPPEEIPRPARPVVTAAEIDPDITIPPTDFGAWDAEDLRPPSSDRAVDDGPTFTPMDVRPTLLNGDEISEALERAYPQVLRDAGIGGTALVWFYIDEEGNVEEAQINQSSGHEQLDAIAVEIADLYEFSPALNRDKRVPVWVSVPIHFRSR